MSTRGIVAVGTPNDWEGVYVQFDAYPSGLGSVLLGMSLGEAARLVKKTPQGFSNFPDSPYQEGHEAMRFTSRSHRLGWTDYVYVIDTRHRKVWFREVGAKKPFKELTIADLRDGPAEWLSEGREE
jgi:hypothetical protein